jgi:hypothetical protein
VPDFTPEAVRDTLTAAGYRELDLAVNMTGYHLSDVREVLGELLIEAHVTLADFPNPTEADRVEQGKLMLGCLLALRLAGYTASAPSSTLIVVTGTRP